ncbi:MAG: hypothetical protein FJ395_19825 [Verrucomicrobia bacterium]|nr:hypothetical protein [Verrucomicrobiota bacterium]
MKTLTYLAVILTAAIATAQDNKPIAGIGPAADETIQRLQQVSATTKFASCCYWAWELELAIIKKDKEVAGRIAAILGKLQRPDGRWGLGTAWGRTKTDFKERLAEDAETWDVAEAANALLNYSETFGDRSVMPRVQKAAGYLKSCVRYAGGKPYLPHMAECNNVLHPHSTICAALLFYRLPGGKELAGQLRDSGVSMKFFRLMPHDDLKTLDPPIMGTEVNDFEKVQIGYYLQLMGDPAGKELLARYEAPSGMNHPRAPAYLVLACAKLGQWDKARRVARLAKDFQPRRGYEYALKDIIDHVNTTHASHGK